MAATVAQSTRELALRMALGADASRLMRLLMSRGLIVTGAGVVVGGVAAWEITRLLGYLLYQVSPHDPIAFGTALGVIGTSADWKSR